MKILMAASEMSPFASSGKMGTEVARLAGSLGSLGHEVSVVLPLHRAVRETAKIKKTGVKFTVPVGGARHGAEIFETTSPEGVQVFLVARDEFFDRSGLYGSESGDYQDNSARFIYFSKAVIELARRMDPQPEILHAHGWQTALCGAFARDARLPVRMVFTPHGLEFQGNFWSYDFSLTNLPGEFFSARGLEFYGSLNFLKGGIVFSDAVVLPSERFAAAAQLPGHGCGMDRVLRENSWKLVGIPDGLEVEGWEPAPENGTPSKASQGRASKRAADAAQLGGELGWEPGWNAAFVTFADLSNGLDVLLGAMDRLLPTGIRLALLGKTAPAHTESLEVARRKHAGHFTHVPEFSEDLAKLALGAADFLLVPGETAPVSPWLLRGLRNGVIPIAQQCGGLHQFVTEWNGESGCGFLFHHPTVDGLVDACRKALEAAGSPAVREKIRQSCTASRFTPEEAAALHEGLYARLLGREKSGSKAA